MSEEKVRRGALSAVVPMAFRVGITGHRRLRLEKLGTDLDQLSATLNRVLQKVREETCKVHDAGAPYLARSPRLYLISPLAEGTDRLAAQAARDQGFKLLVPLPFDIETYENEPESFTYAGSRDEFRSLVKGACLFELDGTLDNKDEAYLAAGKMVVSQCDLLLAVWDGKDEKGKGGTGQIVREAFQEGMPVVWIDPSNLKDAGPLRYDHGKPARDPLSKLSEHLHDTLRPPPKQESGSKWPWPFHRRTEPSRDEGALLAAFLKDSPTPSLFSGLFSAFTQMVAILPVFGTPAVAGELPESEAGEGEPGLGGPSQAHCCDAYYQRHYRRADQLARHYGGLYRSAFLVNYALAALAVMVAVLSQDLPRHPRLTIAFAALELLFIAWILGTAVWGGLIQKWHQRFIDYRLLAEELRQMRFLVPLGRGLAATNAPPAHLLHGDPRDTWVSWYFRALVRAAPAIGACLSSDYRKACQLSLLDVIASQTQYHRRRARINKATHHRLHSLSNLLFAGTLIACFLHLVELVFHRLELKMPFHAPDTLMLLAVTAFPAAAAALHGILSQAEFRRIAECSAGMAARLCDLIKKLKDGEPMSTADLAASLREGTRQPLSTSELGALAQEVAQVMLSELVDWRVVFQSKPLEFTA